jgi:hypothetical protein
MELTLSKPDLVAARTQMFAHLGFPAYFRVVLILAPAPARVKEWAYAGFAINLASALIAHLAVGRRPGGVGLGGGHRRALGALLLLLAPPAGHRDERVRGGGGCRFGRAQRERSGRTGCESCAAEQLK